MKPAKKTPKQAREEALAALKSKELPPDPLGAMSLRSMALRIGPFALIVWIGAFLLNGWIPKAVAGVLTIAVLGVVIWAVRFATKSRAVAEIVRGATTDEERKEAIQKLDAEFKKDDVAAVFAKSQLQLQEDPRAALATLEQIKLDKVMANIADEARAQRGMIHLMLGENDEARALCDAIDMSRHKEAKTRATLGAIVGEAFARTGAAKKAVELLETFDLEDESFKELLPQLLRARAFAYAWANNTKQMKATLKRLERMNVQYLSGFITKKKHPMGVNPRGVHPLLEKEAFDLMQRSGTMQRKMEFRRG